MDKTIQEEALASFVRWGEDQPLVRAMVLTSTRAVPGEVADIFSDYDIILGLSDVHPFFEERGWLEAFGRVLVMYRDPLTEEDGLLKSGNVVQFEGGLKIDFSLWPGEKLQRIAAQA
jgi:aminoglycoside 6-adenylyltransferase